MHGSLIAGMESRINQIEEKLSDVDARASEEADCGANEREMDHFIYSGYYLFILLTTSKILNMCNIL